MGAENVGRVGHAWNLGGVGNPVRVDCEAEGSSEPRGSLRDLFLFGRGAGLGGICSIAGMKLPYQTLFVVGAGALAIAGVFGARDNDGPVAPGLMGMGVAIFLMGFSWKASTNAIGTGMSGMLSVVGGGVVLLVAQIALWIRRDRHELRY
ncbi:MAG: hypothetical protein HYY44_02135 [Deltaproteobacteria bacterium]|nr:hypothetical protein [Deltaproteobacteria bacterium]